MGMTDDGASADDGGSGFTMNTVESMDPSADSMQSATSTEPSIESLDHDLSDHSGFKHKHKGQQRKGRLRSSLESRYSDTNSENHE